MKHRLDVLFILPFFLVSCGIRLNTHNPAPDTLTPQLGVTDSPPLPTATVLPTSTPLPDFGMLLSAVFLKDDQFLDVYPEAGVKSTPVAQFAPQTMGINATGKRQFIDEKIWLEINLPQGGSGWVDGDFITPTIQTTEFCNDHDLNLAFSGMLNSIKSRDEIAFVNFISPIHGLHIKYLWQNPEVKVDVAENFSNLFTENKSYDWGSDQSINQSVQGSFSSIILPALDPVLEDSTTLCNALDQGIAADWTSGFIEWPSEYLNLNYLTLYKPATEENALNWRTWAFGLEKINHQYYLTVLVQYKWDY